ncbi:unnamed protein product [Allacma fusca]|uniref:Uncharacterized protein n=1 Tax=Allacma fusca TaxID=39272 RepID=A0A8J2Q614_9HEXA|nr:unnamed protein product [Allacma fusca]
MRSAIKIFVCLSVIALGLGGETPSNCCEWSNTDTIADRCVGTGTGTFKSQSKCFINKINGIKTDRSDYFRCTGCGSGSCMARLKCSQPCLMYLNGAHCDCWNYFNEKTLACDNLPTTTLPECPPVTTTTLSYPMAGE